MADTAVIGPDISTIDTSTGVQGPDLSGIDTPENARASFIKNHPDGPQEATAALKSADALSGFIDPQVTATAPDVVGESLWGKAKMKAKQLYENVRGSIEGFIGQSDVNALTARQVSTVTATGKEDPELAKQIAEAQSKAQPKDHLSRIPDAILQIPLGMGYDILQGGAFVSDSVAAAVTLEPLRRMVGAGLGTRFYEMGQTAGERFMGSFVGSTYGGLRQEGIDPSIAAPFSIGAGLVQAALWGLKIDKIPGVGPLLEKSGLDATTKAAIGGRLSRTAKTLAVSGGTQGILGAISAGANDVAYELAAITNNLLKENKVPLKSIQQFGEDMGISGLAGAAFGVIAGVPAAVAGIIPGGKLDTRIHEEAAKIEAGADISKKAEAQVSAYHEARQTVEKRKAELSASMDDASKRLSDLRDKLTKASAEEKPAIEQNVRTAAIDVADIKRQVDHPEEFFHRGVDYGENPTVGDVLRFSDKQQEALDAGTQSESVRDEQSPEITDLNKQIEDLQGRLDSAKEEGKARSEKYRATIQENMDRLKSFREEARNKLQASVTAGRERLNAYKVSRKAVESVNANIDYMKKARALKWPSSVTYELPTGETRTAQIKPIVDSIFEKFSDVRHTEGTLEGMRVLSDEIRSHPEHAFSETDLNRVADLEKVPLRDLSKDDLQLLTDAMKNLRHLVTEGDQLRMQGKIITLAEARDDFQNNLKGKQEIPSNVINELPTKKQQLQEAMPRLWNIFSAIGHQDMLWSSIDKMGERGPIFKFMRDILQSEDTRSGLAREWRKPFEDWQKEKNVNVNKWVNEPININFKRSSGEEVTINMRRDTRMSAYLHWQNPNNRQSLIKGFAFPHGPRNLRNIARQLSETEWQQIVNSVESEPREMEYIGLIQDLAKKTGEAMNAVHEKMTGYQMDILDNYWRKRVIPSARGMTAEEAIAQQRSEASMIRASPDKSMTISRTGGTQPIFLTGATEELNNLISDASTYTGMAESIYNAQRVLFDPRISETIRQRVGDSMLHSMQKGLKDDARMYEFAGQADRIVERYRRRGVLMFLGWNPSPVLKNLALTVRSLAYVPLPDWMKGIGESVVHPRNTEKLFVSGSPWYADVKESGALKEIRDVVGGNRIGQKVGNVLSRVFMGPLKWASKEAIKFDMNAGKTQFFREVKEGHFSEKIVDATGLKDSDIEALKGDPEQMMKAAIKYGQFVAQHGHATNIPELQSAMQRGGTFARLVTTFQSEPNANMNMLVRSWMDANVVNKPGAWFRAAKTTAIVLALEPAIMASITGAVRASRGQKQQAPWWDLAGDVAGLIYGGRDVAYGLEQVVKTGQATSVVFGSILGQEVDSAVTAAGMAIRALTAKGYKARAKASRFLVDTAVWLLAGRMGGLPYKPIKSQAEGIIKKLSGSGEGGQPTYEGETP